MTHEFAISDPMFNVSDEKTPFKEPIFIAFYETHFIYLSKRRAFLKRAFGMSEKEEEAQKGA